MSRNPFENSLNMGHDVTHAFFLFNLGSHTLGRAVIVPWFEVQGS